MMKSKCSQTTEEENDDLMHLTEENLVNSPQATSPVNTSGSTTISSQKRYGSFASSLDRLVKKKRTM